MRIATILSVSLLAGCFIAPYPLRDPCPGKVSGSFAHRCGEVAEEALVTLQERLDGLRDFMGTSFSIGGTVEEVEGSKVVLDLEEGRRSFTWPDALPFSIEEGGRVEVDAWGYGTTMRFEEGTLWFHAGSSAWVPEVDQFRAGPFLIRFLEGCSSSQGLMVEPVVFDAKGQPFTVRPGERIDADGWGFKNFGWVEREAGDTCDESERTRIHTALWIAYEIGEVCERYFNPGPACPPHLEEPVRDPPFNSGNLDGGAYRVAEVQEDALLLRSEVTRMEGIFPWPGKLPATFEEGDEVTVKKNWDWRILQGRGKELAISASFGFTFYHPEETPDGSVRISRGESCTHPWGHDIPSLRLRHGDSVEAALLQSPVQIGPWTLELASAYEVSGMECREGENISIVEGLGYGVITAVRDLDPLP